MPKKALGGRWIMTIIKKKVKRYLNSLTGDVKDELLLYILYLYFNNKTKELEEFLAFLNENVEEWNKLFPENW